MVCAGSRRFAAFRFSWRCSTDDVPGIIRILCERCNNHANATCRVVAPRAARGNVSWPARSPASNSDLNIPDTTKSFLKGGSCPGSTTRAQRTSVAHSWCVRLNSSARSLQYPGQPGFRTIRSAWRCSCGPGCMESCHCAYKPTIEWPSAVELVEQIARAIVQPDVARKKGTRQRHV